MRAKLTIILIEHHMDVVMNLCERIAAQLRQEDRP
jgi:ABC-type branched-subunit amino acid transport system ATPase component